MLVRSNRVNFILESLNCRWGSSRPNGVTKKSSARRFSKFVNVRRQKWRIMWGTFPFWVASFEHLILASRWTIRFTAKWFSLAGSREETTGRMARSLRSVMTMYFPSALPPWVIRLVLDRYLFALREKVTCEAYGLVYTTSPRCVGFYDDVETTRVAQRQENSRAYQRLVLSPPSVSGCLAFLQLPLVVHYTGRANLSQRYSRLWAAPLDAICFTLSHSCPSNFNINTQFDEFHFFFFNSRLSIMISRSYETIFRAALTRYRVFNMASRNLDLFTTKNQTFLFIFPHLIFVNGFLIKKLRDFS